MRIALYHNLPSGGAKRTLYEATRRLALKHEIDVYTLSSANHEFCDLRPHVRSHRVYDFRPRPLLSSPFGRANQAIRLADIRRLQALTRSIARDIEKERYDLLLVHPCQFEKAPSLLRHLPELPSVYYCQEPLRQLYEAMPERPYDDTASARRSLLNRIDPLPGLYQSSLRRNDQQNTRSADRVLVNSAFMKRAVDEIYDVDSRISYHGIDIDLFRPLAMEKGDFMLSVGSLTPLKGFDFLIRAMAELPAGSRPALVIASNFQNPPERQYLMQLATELDVVLELRGNVSDEQLVELYNRALVTLYAPVREPFGLVPLESMACRTPVVAVNEGGIRETVRHEQTGLLTERDPAQFAGAIARLLDDPATAQALGHNGLEDVRTNWTWERAVDTLERHMFDCVSMWERQRSNLKPTKIDER